MLKIRVPASTANLGAGFDCFGMALNLYNEFEIDEIDEGVIFLEAGKSSSILLEDNLIYNSMVQTFNKYNHKYKGFYINVSSAEVPLSRGLGSSATCIAAAVTAANHFMNNIMTEQEIINMATEIEGHPDNVAAALKGGFVVSLMDQGNVSYSKIEPPTNLKFAAITPDFKISTSDARKVLPKNYSREDCIFNISRAAMFVSALYSKDYDKLRSCLQDKIHQPYRKTLIDNIDDIFNTAKQLGSMGEFISGSGSTLLAIIDENNSKFVEQMELYLSTLSANWQIKLLDADCTGTKLEIC